MKFHLYEWIFLPPLPFHHVPGSPLPHLLLPPCLPRVSVASHGAITLLFSARLGERRKRMLFERLPEAGWDLGLFWVKEGWVLGTRCHPDGRGWHHARWELREGMCMLITSSWW